MRAELRNRLLMGPIMATVVLGSLAVDLHVDHHIAWLVVMIACIGFGSQELRVLGSRVAGPVQVAPMLLGGWLMLLATWAGSNDWVAGHLPRLHLILIQAPVGILAIGLGMAWTVLIQMWRRAYDHFFTNVALTCFGMIYLGITCSLLLALSQVSTAEDPHRGIQLTMMLLTACKLGDVTAYFGGRTFGKHKMTPRISPGKTWEGFAASFIGAIAGSYIVTAIFQACGYPAAFSGWWQPFVWGLVLGPLGVAGDLAESCMKRQAEVKDSGSILPGFGGWLDVFDAIILAAPVAYILALTL